MLTATSLHMTIKYAYMHIDTQIGEPSQVGHIAAWAVHVLGMPSPGRWSGQKEGGNKQETRREERKREREG